MITHKLQLEDFYDDDYELIAIHSPVEDYRMAFLLNQKLPIQFKKNQNSILIPSKTGDFGFPRYSFHKEEDQIFWDLIPNKQEVVLEIKNNIGDLFEFESSTSQTTIYFLPEFKKVDYFLKLENIEIEIDNLLSIIKTIPFISTSYVVNKDKIKSTNHLIF